MKRPLIIAIFLWGVAPAYSQTHAKCDDAIAITTPLLGPVTAQGWADSSLYTSNDANMYIGKKDKVIWFSFIIPCDTVLTFDIIPVNSADDFDFMLFKADRGDFCQKEKQRKVRPIRMNFAAPSKGGKGNTGLSRKASEAIVGSGSSSSYSAALKVKKGEWYYLVIDNYFTTKDGFNLQLPCLNVKLAAGNSTTDAMPVKAPQIVPPSGPNFFIDVLDSASRPVKASLIIDGVQHKPIRVNASKYSLKLSKDQTIQIRANAPGHMPYQANYSVPNDNADTTFLVKLQPIKAAQKITLEDIQFQQNSPVILPDSKPALDYVLQFLLNNRRVKVIIKGYVNDPNNASSKKFDEALSKKRTNAVRDYLASHGVDKKRMKCVGYGSSEMLYPTPTNKEQQAANRRVEIEIQ